MFRFFSVFLIGLVIEFLVGRGLLAAESNIVTLRSLLEEMVSVESDPCYPNPSFSARQLTSYDRRSVAPGTPGWHANDDWAGFVRYEANNGRSERVLFDEKGPGVLTRIITTGGDAGARLRFYFDDEPDASVTIPVFDVSRFPIDIPKGLIHIHEQYPTKKGCSFYYPIPYAKRCKITVDNVLRRNYVYHVNYRAYEPKTRVETFTLEKARDAAPLAESVGKNLLNPKTFSGNETVQKGELGLDQTLRLELPKGEKAIRTIRFHISRYEQTDYARLMRGLIVKMTFDGCQTVWVPLSDFSGGGMGAPRVENWYMSADGQGNVLLRFVMPYQREAVVELENLTDIKTEAEIQAHVSDWSWNSNTLYFHAAWRQQRGLRNNQGTDYDMATLQGRGVFKADLLSLYNHGPDWYGEGDEHIWVDDDAFPSHFGCGTEDYYNTTYAPIHVFHTPFGGAPREDDEASRGYNTFLRTRFLDAIPFRKKLRFEFELIAWTTATVDYSSTVIWYGASDSKALTSSSMEEALAPMHPPIYGKSKK